MAALSVDGTPMPALPNSADQISYDNTTSGLSATTVKGAVDELASEKQDKSDNSLQTTDKTIVGGINELKSGLNNVVTAEISAEDGVTIIRQNLRKSVNTVTLICMLQKVMTLGTANLLCILPSGYRPPDSFEFVAVNATKSLPIVAEVSSTSGGVYVYPTSASADATAQNICISLTFVV